LVWEEKSVDKKEREKYLVGKMIDLYCRNHPRSGSDGVDGEALKAYAFARLDRCRFGDRKPSCKSCPVHCYRPKEKEEIRTVMRWAGPRIFFYHPISTLRHLLKL
jgi:hypothetical protein